MFTMTKHIFSFSLSILPFALLTEGFIGNRILPLQIQQQRAPHNNPSPSNNFAPIQPTLYSTPSSNDNTVTPSSGSRPLLDTYFERKSPEEEQFIRKCLSQNVLFMGLPDASLQALINGFEKKIVPQEEVICYQGDTSVDDYVYLLAEGECTVQVDGVEVPQPYGTIGKNAIFGDLGVLYNETRQATIMVKSDSVTLYRIYGDTFLNVLNKPPESLVTMQQIDEAINQVSGTKALYGGDIILPYKPERLWLWRQYSGTVLKISLNSTSLNMLVCVLVIVYAEYSTGCPSCSNVQNWLTEGSAVTIVPDKTIPFVQRLSVIKLIWSYQLSLTTFVLTFFLNQSYTFWKKVYGLARSIQGRLNDLHLLAATNVQRNEDGTYTMEAIEFLDDVGQYSRVYHVLMWASIAKRFAVLNTPEGLERMESRGLITSKQFEALQDLDLPNDQLHSACLEWIMVRVNRGMDRGVVAGESSLLGK